MSRVHFLYVKPGACSIIQHDDNKVSMIDVCNASGEVRRKTTSVLEGVNKTFSAIEIHNPKGNFGTEDYTNPTEYLAQLNIQSLFRYIQTHPDMDHMDGLDSIASNFDITNFWDTANTKDKPDFSTGPYNEADWDCYQSLRKSTKTPKAIYLYSGQKNKYYTNDDKGPKMDDYITILSPTKKLLSLAEKNREWNTSSYVILYHTHGRKILFGGDADKETMDYILTNHFEKVQNIDILIAPHHGRKRNQDFSYLKVLNPKLVLIGVADSEHLNYFDSYNHITTRQAGNIVIETTVKGMSVYISNTALATASAMKNKRLLFKHPKFKHLNLYATL